jgi:PAS domain S-box-containing protein
MALPHLDGRLNESATPGAEIFALLSACAVPAILTDPRPDGPIVYANPAFLALTGYAAAEVVGRGASLLQGAKADREGRAVLAAALVADGAGTAEILAHRKDGSAFWADVSAASVAGADGAPAYRVVQVLDVTRRRDAEGALILSRQREALGLLTNSVAHEFNNFLQILIGYIDGLKRRLGDRQEPFIQRAILRSTDAAERATILTRQLLAFSRRIAPDVRPVDLNAVITAFAAAARPTLPTRITLQVRTAPDLPCSLSNPTQVEFALTHILANACEAMPNAGTITIASFAVAPGDHGMQRPADGAVGIAIGDEGQGMTPEMAARALAPFATSREAGRGTGLAIVHGLMKRQNGTVAIDSRPGEGTTVRLIFPAAV